MKQNDETTITFVSFFFLLLSVHSYKKKLNL